MRNKRLIFSALWLFSSLMLAPVWSLASKLDRVEPMFWWAGMNNPELQVMVYGENIAENRVELSYPGVTLRQVVQVANPNYLFLELSVGPQARPGKFDILFKKDGRTQHSYSYELRQRREGSAQRQGFTPADVIYLLMPDRFANGDPGNDDMPGMLEKANRQDLDGRHGGDIKGIANHLDYFVDFGVTTLWINPLLENNMARYSYHGYAMTDFYKVDPRFGTNQDYAELVRQAHGKGLKVIQDVVFNHCGLNHLFVKDPPGTDWVHNFPEYTRSNFRASTMSDPYAARADIERFNHGWFDSNMPDFDQDNLLLRQYLIQHTIFWTEFADLDGIRLDTEPYPTKGMVADWGARMRQEYPNMTLVGEAWLDYEATTAYWQADVRNSGDGFNSGLRSVTDFPLKTAMQNAFKEQDGWTSGTLRLYEVLGKDFLYADPMYNLTFVDNHDLPRYYREIGSELDRFKLGLAFLLTTRGIPMIYYGTELLMDGDEHLGHGHIRHDFPGGWPGDAKNAFTAAGRTADQNEAFDFMRALMRWRKDAKAIHGGRLLHFIPENGVYVYFRQCPSQTVMVLLNNTDAEARVSTARFAEVMAPFSSAKDVVGGTTLSDLRELVVPAKSPLVLELR